MELNPRTSLYFKSLCTLKNTSLPQLLKIFHGIIISVEICICLLSLFSHSKLIESCKPQGAYERSNNMKSQTFGQEATHLRFCQSSGHGSSSRRHEADSDTRGPDEEFSNFKHTHTYYIFNNLKQVTLRQQPCCVLLKVFVTLFRL